MVSKNPVVANAIKQVNGRPVSSFETDADKMMGGVINNRLMAAQKAMRDVLSAARKYVDTKNKARQEYASDGGMPSQVSSADYDILYGNRMIDVMSKCLQMFDSL